MKTIKYLRWIIVVLTLTNTIIAFVQSNTHSGLGWLLATIFYIGLIDSLKNGK